jgi:hypothetical protein
LSGSKKREQNSVAAMSVMAVPLDIEMDIYDQLPLEIKRAIQEAPIKFAAAGMYQLVMQWPPYIIVNAIRQQEANEIAMYAARFRAENGYEYAHTAARATIMRYGQAIPKATNRSKGSDNDSWKTPQDYQRLARRHRK